MNIILTNLIILPKIYISMRLSFFNMNKLNNIVKAHKDPVLKLSRKYTKSGAKIVIQSTLVAQTTKN